jgi:uncharacterized protein (TIGR02598 family)
MKIHLSRKQAFSLIEIVLALGIISFALVAMLGLVGVSLNSGREATSDTDLSSMQAQVVAELQAKSFSTLTNTTVYYFNIDGKLIPTSVEANTPGGALYRCQTTAIPLTTVAPATKYLNLKLDFTWPVGALPANQNKKTFLKGMGNYD